MKTFGAVLLLFGSSAALTSSKNIKHPGPPQAELPTSPSALYRANSSAPSRLASIKPSSSPPPASTLNNTASSAPNPFASLKPSTSLNWTPCAPHPVINASTSVSKIECARFLVPFEYGNTTNKSTKDKQFILAVARWPATDKKNYKGPLFVHFGGPSSGVQELALLGPDIQAIVGGAYDVVAWDQRTVGSTLPAVSCYPNLAAAERAKRDARASRNNRTQTDYTNGLLYLLQNTDAFGRDFGARCQQYGRGLLPYVGTVATARDLAMLVDAYGYSTKLSYWGLSYGTVIGATFSSIFPERVERVILDGNVEHSRYYGSDSYVERFRDVDAELNDFFNLCFLAGRPRCQLWFPSLAEIKAAFYEVDGRFWASPLPSTEGGFFHADEWVLFVRVSLDTPVASWGNLAAVVGQVYREGVVNGTALLNAIQPRPELVLPDPETGLINSDAEAILLIICGDREPFTIKSLEEILPTYDRLASASEWGKAIPYLVAQTDLVCSRYKTRAAERLKEFPLKQETNHPILFIGNTRDVITPLQAAINMTAFFKDSVVLTNNISGHTSAADLFNSSCIQSFVRGYFLNGTLPPKGTVCSPGVLPFDLRPNGTLVDEASSANASILLEV